ncbi:MAG TPA: hypothetical protein V6D08_02320 [Candidatus Obscuribacterales bacterium]
MTDFNAITASNRFSTGLTWVVGAVPLSPVAEGSLVRINKQWRAGGVPWIQISHPIYDREANYRVAWLATVNGERLAVIELEPGWLEDGEPPEQNLVRVVDAQQIQTLTQEEFHGLVQAVKDDALKRKRVAISEVEAAFGPLPELATSRSEGA